MNISFHLFNTVAPDLKKKKKTQPPGNLWWQHHWWEGDTHVHYNVVNLLVTTATEDIRRTTDKPQPNDLSQQHPICYLSFVQHLTHSEISALWIRLNSFECVTHGKQIQTSDELSRVSFSNLHWRRLTEGSGEQPSHSLTSDPADSQRPSQMRQ